MSGSRELVSTLVVGGWVGALVAVEMRSDEALLSRLTEEKSGDSANARFAKDFKTLADVLVQELVRDGLARAFPALRDRVFGEEEPHIATADGRCLPVTPDASDAAKTLACLAQAMGPGPAQRLTDIICSPPPHAPQALPDDLPGLDVADLGLWIDPIDGTNVFISGADLHCVTVSIGLFSLSTGRPLVGVLAQPFPKGADEPQLFWGGQLGDRRFLSPNLAAPSGGEDGGGGKLRVLLSSSEEELVGRLAAAVAAGSVGTSSRPGAVQKLLAVLAGEAEVYALSGASVFAYDSCASAALLEAAGGGLVALRPPHEPIAYAAPLGKAPAHDRGLIAYRRPEHLASFLDSLSPKL